MKFENTNFNNCRFIFSSVYPAIFQIELSGNAKTNITRANIDGTIFWFSFQLKFFLQSLLKPSAMNFYDVVFPIHFMSKLSGITIFSIDAESLTARIGKFDAVLLIWTAIVNFYLNKFFWNSFSFTSHYQSEIIKTSLPILLYGKFWVNILCIIWSVVERKKIVKIVKMIQDVDEMVKIVSRESFMY